MSAREATPLGFSPKGQLLISTRFGDVDQLHLVEHAGGERRQLTFLREPISYGAFSPDPGRSAYVYLKDAGGRGNAQLYYQRLGEPAPRLLTDGKSRNGAPVWSNAGREVAFFSTARDGVSCDIDIVEPATGSLPRLAVTGDNAAWIALDWSPDDPQAAGIEVGVRFSRILSLRRGFELGPEARSGGLSGQGCDFGREVFARWTGRST